MRSPSSLPALALAACGALALAGCGAPSTLDAGAPDAGGGGGGGGAGGGGGSGGGGQGGAGGGSAFDAGPGWGAECAGDGECGSGLCRTNFPGAPKVCVIPCARAADCAAAPDFFCEPLDAGSAQGWCVPRSPAHCLECAGDGDCGTLSAACTATAMDPQRACHVDCALGGEAACPPDYSCVPQTVNGLSRMLCVPTTGVCQDAVGGYCDRLTTSQPCHVTTDGGSCGGQRYCIGGGRYDLCSAPAPQCKPDCSAVDHAGCTENFCDAAVSTPQHCGSCSTTCPGLGATNATVSCQRPTCLFSCQAETYDVDGLAPTGCEVTDAPTGNHLDATATQLPNTDCDDGSSVTGSGSLPSDARTHDGFGAAQGFDATSGSAADLFKVLATGGWTCANDLAFTFTVTGSASPACYRLAIVTDKNSYSCATNGAGTCAINHSLLQYTGGTTITFTVSKTCSSATRDAPSYTVGGHL